MQSALLPALILLAAATGAAEAHYACAVKRTPDGFVALREGPGVSHRMVARMRPQELVGIMHPDTQDIKQEGDWVWGEWFPGTRRSAFHVPKGDEKTAKRGWVNYRLIDCFSE